jgi:hypothetical protein
MLERVRWPGPGRPGASGGGMKFMLTGVCSGRLFMFMPGWKGILGTMPGAPKPPGVPPPTAGENMACGKPPCMADMCGAKFSRGGACRCMAVVLRGCSPQAEVKVVVRSGGAVYVTVRWEDASAAVKLYNTLLALALETRGPIVEGIMKRRGDDCEPCMRVEKQVREARADSEQEDQRG